MSIITIPTGMYFGAFSVGQRRFDIKEMSDATGATKERMRAPPRWSVKLAPPSTGMSYDQAELWKGMLLSLEGGVNHLAIYDVVQQSPRGTMRGSPVTVGVTAAGATSFAINAGGGQANTTLRVGDWLQFGTGLTSQLVMVTTAVTLSGSGTGTVNFMPATRIAYAGGTTVTHDKPVAHYKLATEMPEWAYQSGAFLMTGFNLEFMEQWT